MKALDNIENMLDDEDAKMGKHLKSTSQTEIDDSEHKAPPTDENGDTSDTGDSEDASDEADKKHDEEAPGDWMEELKEMAASHNPGAKGAMSMLDEDDDANEEDEETVSKPLPKKRK